MCRAPEETLQGSLGEFGGEHRDKKDSPAHYTNMISISRIPKEYDPGRFFIVYPGVFVTLHDFISITFSGLRRHCGTPPYAPANADLVAFRSATRVTVIHYSPVGQMEGDQRYALASLPNQSIFHIPPEMTFAV